MNNLLFSKGSKMAGTAYRVPFLSWALTDSELCLTIGLSQPWILNRTSLAGLSAAASGS